MIVAGNSMNPPIATADLPSKARSTRTNVVLRGAHLGVDEWNEGLCGLDAVVVCHVEHSYRQ